MTLMLLYLAAFFFFNSCAFTTAQGWNSNSNGARNSVPPQGKYYPEDDEPEVMGKAFVKHGMDPYLLILRPPPPNAFVNLSVTFPVYKWTFAAADDCMPQIFCKTFNLANAGYDGKCVDQFLEVSDGIIGKKRYCGRAGPKNVVATPNKGLRDLYITFKNSYRTFPAEFECSVACGAKDKANYLPQGIKQNINPRCNCGQKPPRNRIIGGLGTYFGEFPWITAMVVGQTRQPFCIGSVINDRMILTAGHCFKGRFKKAKNLQVVLNGYLMDSMPNINVIKTRVVYHTYDNETLDRLDSGNNSFRYDVDKIIIHPLYASNTSDFDTAVMILSKPIDASLFRTYSPICLPELTYEVDSYAGLTAAISGWGLWAVKSPGTSTIMKQITVTVYQPHECKAYYGDRFVEARRQLCAAYRDASQDSCAGDSGGPLILQYKPQVWYQIGIISWGDSCAVQGLPGVYYRTTSTNQWIRHMSNLKEAVWCEEP